MRGGILVAVAVAGVLSGVIGSGCGETKDAKSRVKTKEIAADYPWDDEGGDAVDADDLRPADDSRRKRLIKRGRDLDELEDEEPNAEIDDTDDDAEIDDEDVEADAADRHDDEEEDVDDGEETE